MLQRIGLTPVLVLAVGLALVGGLPAAGTDKVDAEKIARLVKDLGSPTFTEREEATKQLDGIGTPALEALRKAAKSDDFEVKARAEELVKKIEKRAESEKLLRPTRLHLTFKDTPVRDAVAEIGKKTGYQIVLHDPDNKLADRKVTLDTGETTFWQAFDQFCKKAGLTEGTLEDVLQTPPLPPGGFGGPGGGAIEIQTLPVRPLPPAKPLPVEFKNVPGAPASAPAAVAPPVPPVAAGKAEAGAAVQVIEIQIAPGGGPGIPPVVPPRVGIARPVMRPLPGMVSGQIVLKDGKAQDLPTCYAGAVRIRALPVGGALGQAPDGEIIFPLEVTPEPKLQWQQFVALQIDKALDDAGQTLSVASGAGSDVAPPPGNVAPLVIRGAGVRPLAVVVRPIRGVMMQQPILVHLKKGDKEAKALKELKGTITAKVRTPAEALVTVDNLLKSSGKTFTDENGASIKVLEASKGEDGEVKLRVELDYPSETFPAANRGPGLGGIGVAPPVGAIRILPAPAPALVPPPLPPPPPALPPVKQLQAKFEIQLAPPGPAVGGPAAPPALGVTTMPTFRGGYDGLVLTDAKGAELPLTWGANPVFRGKPGGGLTREYTFSIKVEKDKPEPAKLTFSGSRIATVDIPFTLKDIPIK